MVGGWKLGRGREEEEGDGSASQRRMLESRRGAVAVVVSDGADKSPQRRRQRDA